jgi:MoaA/NifB/PqqE/SkfB family radical SAM enzyme
LDGAALYFHPLSGTNVRIETEATRHLSRQAPRVAMFGITNACNMSCDYCSRDTRRDSRWTVPSAAQVLRGLAAAGTLEVAFGGGEPFAFRGFGELVSELYETTPLALHATSNGSLLNDRMWRAFASKLGQIRLSFHDPAPFWSGARLLAGQGQLWGANLLVADRELEGLPALLRELAGLACHDVSLLRYVGPDPRRHLSATGIERLRAIIADAPLACRVSVCFGSQLSVSRLFDGADDSGDCGAGYDFLSITPDRKVQSCSFQDHTLDADSAEDILRVWRASRARLASAASRLGCARMEPGSGRRTAGARPAIAIWQAFSGNNSGECVMVAKFESGEDAQAYLSRLVPGWTSDEPYSAEWLQLFRDEGVATPDMAPSTGGGYDDGSMMPRELFATAKTVIALAYHVGDAFPELRALAWKRGAHVIDGIHVHDNLMLLAAIRAHDSADVRKLLREDIAKIGRSYQHGEIVLLVCPLPDQAPETLDQLCARVRSVAADRAHSVEIVTVECDEAAMIPVLQRLGNELPLRPRLVFSSHGVDSQQRLETLERLVTSDEGIVSARVGGTLLVEGIARRKRLAVLGYRHGASVRARDAAEQKLNAAFWFEQPPSERGRKSEPVLIDPERLRAALTAHLPRGQSFELECPGYAHFIRVVLTSSEPALVLAAFGRCAGELGSHFNVWLADTNQLALAVHRVVADVR